MRNRLSLAISVTALAVALGGVPAVEAAISLARGSVGTPQLKAGAVTGAKVRDGSLRAVDFGRNQLPAGAQGPQGVPGATGTTGPQGPIGADGPPGPATGPAGGDLAGTYPNPAIAAGAVGSDELAAGSVTPAKLGPGYAVLVWNPGGNVPNGVQYDLPFANEYLDAGGLHSGTSPLLVAPVRGIYSVYATVEWSANVTGFRELVLIGGPGSPVPACASRVAAVQAAGVSTRQSVSCLMELRTGDAASVSASQTSGAPLAIENAFGSDEAGMVLVTPLP